MLEGPCPHVPDMFRGSVVYLKKLYEGFPPSPSSVVNTSELMDEDGRISASRHTLVWSPHQDTQ